MSILDKEFQRLAIPSQELLLKLAALSDGENSPVISARKKSEFAEVDDSDIATDFAAYQMTLEYEERIQAINERLKELDSQTQFELVQAEQHLQELREQANQNKKGQHIYQDEDDGSMRYEDGQIAEPQDVDYHALDADAPSYQMIRDARSRFDNAQHNRARYEAIRDRSDKIESVDDLDALEREISALEADVADTPAPPQLSENGEEIKGSFLSSFVVAPVFSKNDPKEFE
ncbi:hypothetical protein [Sneathiella sp.]|uniref:hypothetical protein n=1 Tax=Sneathiella sp. TaxID=1964365 RepID=UPI0026046FCC|nr:hypothetical protein [Sneathiella sp.]MDF2365642.1 hypothetical protein [Sneathiella sp.]